jgi:polysaccharide export outer membrane protein
VLNFNSINVEKRMSNKSLFYILVVLVVGLTSCRVLNPSQMFQTPDGFRYGNDTSEVKEYIIQPFDKLNIRVYTNNGGDLVTMEKTGAVFGNNQRMTPYMVEHDGMAKVPSLGRVKLSGLTVKEAEAELEKRYSKDFKDPFVLVNVTNRRVVVFASGSSTGTVLPMENERFTLIEALATAGGIDDFSKAYRVKLIRGDLSDPEVFLFDISSVEEIKKANLVLQANDIIYVESKPRYASRVLSEITPYIALFNTVFLVIITANSF